MSSDTKEAILRASEKLFAKHGFKETSLRSITAAAGVNLAAVNYHFGSKDALIEALLADRLRPMNRDRLQRLDALRKAHPNGDIPVDQLIRAFVAPALDLSRDTEQGGAVFVRLLGRTYIEPSANIQNALRELYDPVIQRFRPAFSAALPELPEDELYWRLHFVVGLLAYLMSGSNMMRLIASSHLSEAPDSEQLIERLISFAGAGMRAPLGAAPAGAQRSKRWRDDYEFKQ